jgi:hypothetical protein
MPGAKFATQPAIMCSCYAICAVLTCRALIIHNLAHLYITHGHATFLPWVGPARFCRRILTLRHCLQRKCLMASPSVLPERCVARKGPMYSSMTVDFQINPTSSTSSCMIPKEDPSFKNASIPLPISTKLTHASRLPTMKHVTGNDYTKNWTCLTLMHLTTIRCTNYFKNIGLSLRTRACSYP